MGLFDRFKKKDKPAETPVNEDLASAHLLPKENIDKQTQDEAYAVLSKYREHIVLFLQMQLHGNFAPIGAYEDSNGQIYGFLYMAEDPTFNITVQDSLEVMAKEFETRMSAGSIVSYTIFYHSKYSDHNNDHSIAEREGEFKAFSIRYKSNEAGGMAALPYFYEDNGEHVRFGGLVPLSREQSDSILRTQLEQGKDYFDEKISLLPPVYENEHGIKIVQSNQGALGSMWAGILGYERMNAEENLLLEYCAYTASMEQTIGRNDAITSELRYDEIVFRAVKNVEDTARTVYPVLKTKYVMPFSTTQINEWVNIASLEAMINGGGRDKFGLSFFATDYAENKDRYQLSKNIEVHLSGILQVLAESNTAEWNSGDGPKYSEDFCAYIPNNDFPGFGGFDFVGILRSHREVRLLDDRSVEGYIINVQVLNIEDEPDAFTIDMFINKQNMRFEKLRDGMKITGCFLLQGELV